MGVPQEDGGCRKLPCDLFDTNVEIVDNGVKCIVDVKDGQKTGFFLDQKYNRLAIQRLCKGAKVLDCFTHTGLFALNAGVAGAASVLGVDASELAVRQAGENAKLNGLEHTVHFRCEDVFELLPELEHAGISPPVRVHILWITNFLPRRFTRRHRMYTSVCGRWSTARRRLTTRFCGQQRKVII